MNSEEQILKQAEYLSYNPKFDIDLLERQLEELNKGGNISEYVKHNSKLRLKALGSL